MAAALRASIAIWTAQLITAVLIKPYSLSTSARSVDAHAPQIKPVCVATDGPVVIHRGKPLPSVEWIGRPTTTVNFLGQSQFATVVYETDFFGSTLGYRFWPLLEYNRWEPETLVVLRALLDGYAESSYIDYGAWLGPTVLWAARFSKHVYALEPDPLAFSALVANVHANDYALDRTSMYFECISTERGEVQMTGRGDSMSQMGANVAQPAEWEDGRGVLQWVVPARTLPQFVAEEGVKNLRLIKIDTEGAELFLVPSMKAWLQGLSPKPALWLSVHPVFWLEPTDKQKQALWDVIALYRFAWDEHLQVMDNSPHRADTLDKSKLATYLLSDEPVTF